MDSNISTRRQWWATLVEIIQQLGWLALGGLVAAVAMLALFAELTEDIFSNEFNNLDKSIELGVHSWANPWLDSIFNFFSTIGGVIGVIVITGLIFGLLAWRRHFATACVLIIAVAGGAIINFGLKQLFQRPRPHFWISNTEPPSSFSFPSGHATMALCLFGALTWVGLKFIRQPLWRLSWSILMLFLIGVIGLSRIYLGVHYPTDIAGGYLSGSIWLVVLLSGRDIYKRLRPSFLKKKELNKENSG